MAAATIASTRIERLGVERLQHAAALARRVAVLVAGDERVAPGAVPGVDVAHEPGALQRLEVPVDGAEVGGRQPPAEAAGDLLGADGAVGGEQRLHDGAPRGGDPEARGRAGTPGQRELRRPERPRVMRNGHSSLSSLWARRSRTAYSTAYAPLRRDRITRDQATCGTAWSVSMQPTPTMATADSAGSADDDAARHRQAAHRAAREHHREPEPGERRRQPRAERDDHRQPERDLALRHGGEEHDQRRRARDQPGGGAHREQPAGRDPLGRRVAVAVIVVVVVVVAW